jgi:multiple sugar transport system ATP-binding protein
VAEIVLSKLNKHYGTAHHAVQDLDLVIADQEFIALVGPSGCGKSTTLRMIAGLEDISGGEIRIGGRLVNDLPPKDRDIAMVFQNYALYQHMTVYDNLAFGLRNKKLPEDRVKMEIDRAASILGLQELMQRRPRQLSGGQQQRVALGRCIVRNPQAFLFDEPLSNLDAKLRTQMRIEIKRLRTRIPTTSVFVTHDQVEAMTLGDRVVVMMDGRIQQVGTPLEVYNAPANKFVASFIGAPAMNFFEVNIVGEGDRVYARTPFFSLPVGPARHRSLAPFAGKSVIAGIRPEHLLLAENGTPDTFEAKVEVIEQLGAEIVLEARAKEAEITVARVEASTPLQQGQLIRLGAKPGAMQFFEIGSEAAIL